MTPTIPRILPLLIAMSMGFILIFALNRWYIRFLKKRRFCSLFVRCKVSENIWDHFQHKVIRFYFTKYQLRRTYLMSTFFQELNLKSCLIRASQEKQEETWKFSRLVHLIQPESFIKPYLIFGIICGGGSDHQMNLPTDSQSWVVI